jgi:PAS domain S-box-containing protein
MKTPSFPRKEGVSVVSLRGFTLSQLDRSALLERLELYDLVLDSIFNGVVVTDSDGYILYFNRPYGRFLGVNPDEQIGRHVTEVINNTRMHIVAKTGKAEINHTQKIRGQNMVVQRIPIKRDGRVVAVFGQVMFKDVRDVHALARKLSLLESKVRHYEEELISIWSSRYTLESIVGVSEAMRSLKREALKAAGTNLPVLITGESGTGKELFAHAIHHASPRRLHPFIRINCAAIPKDLLESELFGYERGAFTGARSEGKPGKFELAHHGTIFLDEIGELPLTMQPKLLRALEEKEFERVGGTSVIQSDFRLIAASNQSLEEMVKRGRFRKDLFYRLNVIPLYIPPLRDRKEDILPLAFHILKQLSESAASPEVTLDPEVQEVLMQHDWPGNVRELSNVLERAFCSLEGDRIRIQDLAFPLRPHDSEMESASCIPLKDAVSRIERDAILQALAACENNKTKAARLLGIHRTLLYKKMRRHGIPTRGEC